LGRVGFGTKTAEPSILVAVSPFSFSFSWSQLVTAGQLKHRWCDCWSQFFGCHSCEHAKATMGAATAALARQAAQEMP